MAEITASLVKELREMTGAGMMECKKALTEAEGDIDAAVDILRKKGEASIEKKAGRATNEGRVVAVVAEDGKSGAVIELQCETDFVAINDKFKAYGEAIAQAVLAAKATDVEAALAAPAAEGTVADIVKDAVHIMGENIQLSKVQLVEADGVVSYVHGVGNIGVLVEFDTTVDPTSDGFVACGRDVAMQVAAMNPIAANREAVDPAVVEHEMEIYKAQAAESGKPENIQEKIATGRLEKFYKEQCLTEQDFVKDSEKTVGQYVAACAKELGGEIAVKNFVRMQLGA